MKIVDGVVVAASCFMAMHVFSVWMALGVWVALRASSLLETASDAQALVVRTSVGDQNQAQEALTRKVATISGGAARFTNVSM